jgi:hypothetical protein
LDHNEVNKKTNRFTVHLLSGNDEKIVIQSFKEWVSVSFVNAKEEDYGASVGLLGNFHTGARLARDGVTVMDDAIDFGQAWQVLPSDPNIFEAERGPQYPAKCILPDTAQTHRRLGEQAVSRAQAEKACIHRAALEQSFCIKDVMASNDLEMPHAGAF